MLLKLLFGWFIVWIIRTNIYGNGTHKNSPQNAVLIHEPIGRITGSFFHINYETSWANDVIAAWFNPSIRWKRELLEVWFSGGVILMGIGQCMSLLLFTYILYKSVVTLAMRHDVLSDDFSEPVEHPLVMPGNDVDTGQLMLFWASTLVVLLVHELGHAAAASMERLYIQGFGIFFVFMFPGAYVRVENSVQYLSTRAQLRIYSAGVWHNFCFALFVFAAIELGPFMLPYTGFSRLPVGLIVLEVQKHSPLHDVLPTGDVISRINGIAVHSVQDFENIVKGYDQLLRSSFLISKSQEDSFRTYLQMLDRPSHETPSLVLGAGLCREVYPLQMRFDERHTDLRSADYDPLECCKDLLNGQGSNADGYCFSTNANMKNINSHQRASPSQNFSIHSGFSLYRGLTCLSPRDVIMRLDGNPHLLYDVHHESIVELKKFESEIITADHVVDAMRSHSSDFCLSDLDCGDSSQHNCVRPLSTYPLTLMRLDIVGRAGSIIIEYSPVALLTSLKLGSYQLNSKYFNDVLLELPILYKFILNIPAVCYFFCWLCVQLSISVGLLNMVPAKYLDGGLAFPQFARMYISRRWCTWISDVVVGFGSCLVVLNLAVLVIPMIKPFIEMVVGFTSIL